MNVEDYSPRSGAEKRPYLIEGSGPLRCQLAFPNNQHIPTQFIEPLKMMRVALDIPAKLWLPVFLPCPRKPAFAAARVLVPKAPMYENHFAAAGKNEIGFSWKVLAVDAEAVTLAMQLGPETDFVFVIW